MNLRKLGGIALVMAILAVGVFVLAQPGSVATETTARSRLVRSMAAPGAGALTETAPVDYSQAVSPVAVDIMATNPIQRESDYEKWLRGDIDFNNEFRATQAEMDAFRAEALTLAPNANVQDAALRVGGSAAPALLGSFDSIDSIGQFGVPPDSHMAAGSNHLIATVNSSLQVYDKSGAALTGVISADSFLAVVPACNGTFDPTVVYDEEADRFAMVWDANGTHMCVAVTQTADPVGSWWVYGFAATPFGGEFFDYPHTGVGDNYIVVGSNQFGGGVPGGFEGRVWAMDKADLYAGAAVTMITESTTIDYGTPQPLHLHGFQQGTWPAYGDTHYVVTDLYDGCTMQVWQWDIGTSAPTIISTVDLCAETGVASGQPVAVPQLGSSNMLEGNDWRMRMFEYRNGSGWVNDSISCNPGGGTVNCLRWVELDLTVPAPTAVQAGVYASDGEYRTFGDLAVNTCGDMAIGYTKSSASMYASLWYTGRESTDPLGMLAPEAELKAGEVPYESFDGSPYRWGDYSAMTIDPDGVTFWYIGEYSKDIVNFANWGNYIGKFAYTACGGGSDDPVINVVPGSLSSTQPTDTMVDLDLDINNVGGADLDWNIYEDAAFPLAPITAGRDVATVAVNGVSGLSAAGVGTGVRVTPESQANRALQTITQSATQSIVSLNSVSCNAGGLHTDNSYLRVFDLSSYGITGDFDVTDVEIGVETATGATGSQPIAVNLYIMTDPGAPLTFGNLTPIGSTSTTVGDQALTLWSTAVTGTAPAGSMLVVEIFTPEGQTAGNSFFIGSNPDGETGPSYLAAADCGITEPTSTVDIGFPGMHIVMNVTGDTDGGGGAACDVASDIAWASVAPDSGTTASAGTETVVVTLDSTGLADGTYDGTLCVESNDPATPLVAVPLELMVEAGGGGGEGLSCNAAAVSFEDGAFPSGWSITTNALPGGEWLVSTDNSSAFWDPGAAPDGVYYASANDDAPGSGSDGSADYMYSNIIDLSAASAAELTFQYYFDGTFGQVAGGVEVSGDGGATWDGETVVPAGDVWQGYILNLDAYAGNANVQVRFHADDGGAWASGYAVDDVSLGCEIAASLVCNGPVVGFETGTFPDDWSTSTLALPGGEWLVSMDNSSAFWDPGAAPEGVYYASANDDAPGSGSDGSADYMVTGIIDLSGVSSASMSFDYHFDAAFSHAAGGVEVSSDGGATWDGEIIVPAGDAWQNYMLDLDAYAGNSMVQVRFHSDDGGAWASGYAVDAVGVACEVGVGPIIEVDPTTVHSMQLTDTTNDETFDINNVGDADLMWEITEDAAFPMAPISASRVVDNATKVTERTTIGDADLSRAGVGTGIRVTPVSQTNRDLVTITHSATQDIVQFNSVSCNAGGLHTDNSYMRVFDLASFGITDAFDVTEVEVGVETAVGATGSQPVDVNLYILTNPADPLTFGNLTPIGSTSAVVSDQDMTILTVPVVGTAPAGSVLVVELFTPEGQTAGNSFFIGSNSDGETGPSYLSAADCGITEPTPTGAIGFPEMQIVMNVTGDTAPAEAEVCDVASDISWASVSPTAGTTAAAGSDTVTVTFDSTGLVAGEYEGTLCVESNDPQNPLVTVLLQLWVEDDPTAVEMADLSATVNADGTVSVNWVTAAEVGNAGFNVYRSVSADAMGTMLNSELIGSTASAGAGAAYSFVDANVGSGVFYYWVEAVSVDGATTAHGPVEAVTQAPTSASLTSFGGNSSALLSLLLVAAVAVALLGGVFVNRRKA